MCMFFVGLRGGRGLVVCRINLWFGIFVVAGVVRG